MSIIIAILGFSLLVFVHELGHFIFARLTGMEVEKFSIGFGPALYRFGKTTQYQIALLPFGGFVQIKGLAPKPPPPSPPPQPVRTLDDIEREWGLNGVFSVEGLNDPLPHPDHVLIEEPEETEEERVLREAEELRNSFQSKSLFARFLVVSGGPLFNLIFTIFVFWWLFATNSAFKVGELREASLSFREISGAAAKANIQPGDVLLQINGKPAKDFYELKKMTSESKGTALQLMFARPPTPQTKSIQQGKLFDQCMLQVKKIKVKIDDPCAFVRGIGRYEPIADPAWSTYTVEVTPEKISEGVYRLGLTPELVRYGGSNLWHDLKLANRETYGLIQLMSEKLLGGIRGTEDVEVASVVKITAISADTVKMGNEWFFNFLAFLSLNLAFLNLLPFPALDGGRLIFLAIEAISRRPVNPKIEMIVHGIGILFLIILTIWITTKDVISLM